MGNSAMVTYIKLSPNCSKPRDHAIDTITIHHMASNCSVETCGDIFAPTSRKASSNYGVDSKGHIGMYVEECNRSWCSSNRVNDNRAITIEVANDGGAPNWHVSDTALNTTIKLVVDICRRNGIKKLIWSDNKNDRVNHANGCNMTLHQDFSSTSCPGPYLKSKMSYIAQKVNEELFNNNTDGNDDGKLYHVQVGAYKVKANADAMAAKLKKDGYDTIVK